MKFLHINECTEWCRDHGMETADHGFELLDDPKLNTKARILFAWEKSTGLEPRVLESCIRAFAQWDECLLWVTGTGVWANSEDWPALYDLRKARGERTSLDNKPGHLFFKNEEADLRSFLLIMLNNGWDVFVLPIKDGVSSRRIDISHDGYVDLLTPKAEPFELA